MEVTLSFLYQESEKEGIIRFTRGSVTGIYYNSIVKLENTLNEEIKVFTKFSYSEEELEEEVESQYGELETEFTLHGKDEYLILLQNNFDAYLRNNGYDELVRRYLVGYEIDNLEEDKITSLLTNSYYLKHEFGNILTHYFVLSKLIVFGSNRSLRVSVGKLIGSNSEKPQWLRDKQQISGSFIADRIIFQLHFIVNVDCVSTPLKEPHLSLSIRLQKNGTKRISVGELFSDHFIFNKELLESHIIGKFMINNEKIFLKFELIS